MSAEPSIRSPKPRRLALLLCAVAVGAIGLVVSGETNRARSREEVAAWTNEQSIPTVRVVQPERGPAESELTLPGNVAAYNSSALFARASGYIASWSSDIGAHVRQGDVLATISAPDLDQQLAEAKAQLVQLQAAVAQAQATADLGRVTDQRTARLVQQGWSSAEQGDTDHLTAASRDAALAVAKANVTAQLAAVARFQELTKFEQITAPFDGVVTQRTINIGDLVNAGGNSGTPMFQVSDIHRMRIYVNVPQAFLGELKPGIKATLRLPGQQETFEATLSTTANAVTANSRTALIELDADNPDGKLWPGAFAEVQFHIPSDPNALRIPATALVFGAQGMRVATLDANDKVALKPVTIGRNLGNRVEIAAGVALIDRLIDNPTESTQDGDLVQVAGAPPRTPPVATAENAGGAPAAKND
jgi:RND family efflux transporter MFP subunit